MRNKKRRKGKETMKIKAKEKAFIGVGKGLPVTQKLSQKEGLFFIAKRQIACSYEAGHDNYAIQND